MNFKKYFLPKAWTEKKISEDSHLLTIPQVEIDAWKTKRWKKDNVEKLIGRNGFHMKPDGRSGTVYFVQENQVCEIYFEVSGVKEFDILIFFERLIEWELPERKAITQTERQQILEKLKIWLNDKAIKSDL